MQQLCNFKTSLEVPTLLAVSHEVTLTFYTMNSHCKDVDFTYVCIRTSSNIDFR